MMLKLMYTLFLLVQTMSILFAEEISETYINSVDRKIPSRNNSNILSWNRVKQRNVKTNISQLSFKYDILNHKNKLNGQSQINQPIHLKRRKRSVLNIYKVAALLAQHKYIGVDPRPSSSDQKLNRQFPIPPVMHPVVRNACESSVSACIDEISQFHNFRRRSKLSTFSKLEQFEYLTTASYYMCWYTMQHITILRRLDYNNKFGFKCLHFNIFWKDENMIPHVVENKAWPPIFDIRLIKNKRPFLCAELSFCPDPCYGGNTNGVVDDLNTDSSNPCSSLPNSRCVLDQGKNVNFLHLIRNDFNYSCSCQQIKEGFVWDKKLRYCIDQDECYEGLHNCPSHMICQNTMGSFDCLCSWGYRWDGSSCTNISQLDQKHLYNRSSKEAGFMQMKNEIGFSGSQRRHYLPPHLFISLLLVFRYLLYNF